MKGTAKGIGSLVANCCAFGGLGVALLILILPFFLILRKAGWYKELD